MVPRELFTGIFKGRLGLRLAARELKIDGIIVFILS